MIQDISTERLNDVIAITQRLALLGIQLDVDIVSALLELKRRRAEPQPLVVSIDDVLEAAKYQGIDPPAALKES